MFREYFLLLLLGHVLGDFYIQTTKMAEKKINSLKWVFIHCTCYLGMMLLVGLPIMSWEIALGATIAAITHLLIDIAKYAYLSFDKKKRKLSNSNSKDMKETHRKSKVVTSSKGKEKKVTADQVKAAQLKADHSPVHLEEKSVSKTIDLNSKVIQIFERNTFIFDQILHVVCLIAIAYWAVQSNIVVREWTIVQDFFEVVGLSEVTVMTWFLALFLIHKPANIMIAKLLMIYKPANDEGDHGSNLNAGRFIGTVERIIMLIFLSTGQYSAIGLVLTAKSIARYDRITKDPAFAEYYLLGTLLSTLFVILTSFAL